MHDCRRTASFHTAEIRYKKQVAAVSESTGTYFLSGQLLSATLALLSLAAWCCYCFHYIITLLYLLLCYWIKL